MDNLHANCPVCETHANKKCGKCKILKYCGQDCQKLHWTKYHKKVCMPIESTETALKFIQNYNTIINDETDETELVYWFGTLMKVIPYLLQFISKEQITSTITNQTINMLLSNAIKIFP